MPAPRTSPTPRWAPSSTSRSWATREGALQAVRASRASISEALEAKRLDDVIGQLASLREPIDAFFADVMVMDEHVALRENRLRLLNNLVEVFSGIANVGELARKK